MRKFDIDDHFVLREIEEIAESDFEFVEKNMFFFGELYNENPEFVSEIEDGKVYVRCPSCGKLTKISTKEKTGDDFVCPSCGEDGSLFDFHDKNLELSNIGYSKIAYFQNIDEESDDEYVLRIYEFSFDYSNREYDNYFKLDCYPDLSVNEIFREYWTSGKEEYYKFDAGDWIPVDANDVDESGCYLINWGDDEDIGYLDDFHDRYCSFLKALNDNTPLKAYKTFKKYKFDTLATECLRVTKDDSAIFPDDDRISILLQGVDYNKLISQFNPVEVNSLLLEHYRKTIELGLSASRMNIEIFNMLPREYYSVENVKRTFKYIRNLMRKKHSVCDYVDYLKNCKKLKKNISSAEIRYPSDFKKAHDEAYEQVLYVREKNKIEKYKKHVQKYSYIKTFSKNGNVVLLAENPMDLIKEGEALHHCVGTYISRVAEERCLIFFIRKEEALDVPFYTLEYIPETGVLIQCRGLNNKNYEEDDSVKETVSAWLLFSNKKTCAKEKLKRAV